MSERLWAACPFCHIIHNDAPATIVKTWHDTIAVVPLNPVIEGHILVIPKIHAPDYRFDPIVTATTFARAAEMDIYPSNLITSAGSAATQSVRHLHVHIVPRHEGDGLLLPWTAQQIGDTP